MNKEDVGSYFIRNGELFYCYGYIDRPVLTFKNVNTGQREFVVIDSIVEKEFSKLFSIPCNNGYNLNKAEPVEHINLEKEVE